MNSVQTLVAVPHFALSRDATSAWLGASRSFGWSHCPFVLLSMRWLCLCVCSYLPTDRASASTMLHARMCLLRSLSAANVVSVSERFSGHKPSSQSYQKRVKYITGAKAPPAVPQTCWLVDEATGDWRDTPLSPALD
ncbi:hypothetical protein ACLKA6_011680 [Drosophila palustris]